MLPGVGGTDESKATRVRAKALRRRRRQGAGLTVKAGNDRDA